jgi:hypothetical protein
VAKTVQNRFPYLRDENQSQSTRKLVTRFTKIRLATVALTAVAMRLHTILQPPCLGPFSVYAGSVIGRV